MSWLPDPTKFLRRSYRKGDGDHQEKPAKIKGASKTGGTSSKHSSLYSLMQASSTRTSLERLSTEDDNPSSMYGAVESTTHLSVITDSTDALSSHSHAHDANDLALIRHAANVLLSNVPSSQVHDAQHAIKEDASPHDIKDPHASHLSPHASTDPSASHLHAPREPLAEGEGTKGVEDPLSRCAGVILEEGFSFAALATSENEDIDESECKVISEDLAALRASPDGKINSLSTLSDAKEKRKGKGDIEQYSKRKSPVGGGRKEPNNRKSSAPEKNRQPNSRKSSQRGEGKKSSNKKNLHSEQSRENPKKEKEMEASPKHSQVMEYYGRELDQALILLEDHAESMADHDIMLERDRLYNHKEPTNFDSRKSPIIARKEPKSPLMPHQAFALQDSEGTGESARISMDRDVPKINPKRRSPTLIAGRRSESNSPLMAQHQDFLFQEIEVMEEKGRNSFGREASEINSRRRSPLMVGRREPKSSSTYQAFSLQDSDIMEDSGRVSIGHDNMSELSRRRSPLMVARREPNSPVTSHQDFSLQDHEVMVGGRPRVSVSYDSIELGSRRSQSPSMVARRDANLPSTPSYLMSSLQESEILGERARVSIGFEAPDTGSRRQSPLILTSREPNSPLTPDQNFSLRDINEMMGERARLSVGRDGQELGLRRHSPFMGGRKGPTSPLMQHHNFLLPDTQERARRSVGRDIELGLSSSRRSPFTAPRQESKRPMVSSERFYLREDELQSLYDRAPSPFLASQASLLRERQGSVYIDDITALPATSPRIFVQNDGSRAAQHCEPTSPLVSSKRYILQEDQRAYSKPISPYLSNHRNFSHGDERVYAEGATSPVRSRHDFYSQDDSEQGYDDDDDVGSTNKRSSFYYEHPQGGSISRDNYSSPLMSQRRETLDMSMLSNETFVVHDSEEELYDEQLAESNEFVENDVFSDSAKRDTLIGEDEAVAMVQHYMRQQRSRDMQHLQEEEDLSEMQLQQEQEDQLSQLYAEEEDRLSQLYAEVLSENSIKSSYSKKQRSYAARSKAEAAMSMSSLSENSSKSLYSVKHRSKEGSLTHKAEAMSMQSPISEANSSISSGKRMMKKLEEAQAEIAVVRRARRGFEEMVVEMVGSGGGGEEDYAVQNLLDLEEFVGSYESLSSSSGIFKGMVDQFFHELCCELLQPVITHEDDSVLSMALLRLEQMYCSPL